jgi:hypothetical protein
MFVPIPYYAVASQWFLQRHGDFPLLIHPNSGCEYEDHTVWALWTGAPSPYPLDPIVAGMVPWTQTGEFDEHSNTTVNQPCLNRGMTCRSSNPVLASTQSMPCCFPRHVRAMLAAPAVASRECIFVLCL